MQEDVSTRWARDPLAAEVMRVVGLTMFWALWVCAGSILTRECNGYLLIVHGCVESAAGLAILSVKLPAFREQCTSARVLLGAGHTVWGLGDVLWAVNYFIAGRSGQDRMGMAVTACCALAFIFLASALIASTKPPRRAFFEPRLTCIGCGVAAVVLGAMLVFPEGLENQFPGRSIYALCEALALLSAYVALAVALMVAMASRDLGWSIHAAGIMCLVLGDSAIRLGKIFGGSTDVDVFLVLCSVGFYSCLFPVLGRESKRPMPPVDFRSLFTSYKLSSLGIIIACVAVFLSAQSRDLFAVRLIALCCGFGTFVAIFLSAFIVSKIKAMATLMGAVLQGELSPVAAGRDKSKLPLELREHYDIVFSNAVSQQKTALLAVELESKTKILRKVAHNILSPVAVLRSLVQELTGGSEENRFLFRAAIYDISDMAHSLSANESVPVTGDLQEPVMLASLLEEVVSKKRIEYRRLQSISIAAELSNAYGVFVHACEAELRSVLSNLINNAVEAIDERGAVTIALTRSSSERCEIEIRDDGCGIPNDLLPVACDEGVSFGKPSGTGYGLFHARRCIESWGGSIHIDSRVADGTSIFLRLRSTPPAAWFVSELRLPVPSLVVVVDDNPAIHRLWERRLVGGDAPKGVQLLRFHSLDALRSWSRNAPEAARDAKFLVDFDLQETVDGLTAIKELDISDRSILVTSYSNDARVRARCSELGTGLLPKSSIGSITIRWIASAAPAEQPRLYDAVFVDDDAVFRQLWSQSAEARGLRLLAFATVEQFYEQVPRISRQTPIYVDSELGFGVRGEMEAQKIHRDHGFETVILSTGHAAHRFENMPWLAGVITKVPPWHHRVAESDDP